MKQLQKQIIQELGVHAVIDPKEEIRKSIDFMKSYLRKYPFLKTLVLGISGGQDSSLAGRLAQLTMEEMRQETQDSAYQFIAVRLPYGKQADEVDAQNALSFIQPDSVLTVDIQPAVDACLQSLETANVEVSDFNKGNMKARQRMIVQYAIAGQNAGAVVGTDHAAENLTGFFTKYGDGGADILPLYRLNKRQGKALLKELGALEKIYTKIPTADLEDNQPLIADEIALGITYDEIDDYLEGKELMDEKRQIIESWYSKTEHKRHLPISIFDDFWQK